MENPILEFLPEPDFLTVLNPGSMEVHEVMVGVMTRLTELLKEAHALDHALGGPNSDHALMTGTLFACADALIEKYQKYPGVLVSILVSACIEEAFKEGHG